MVYDTTPPAINLKCIVGTALLASGYWYLPSRNKYVLLSLCYLPYLAIAWYDYIYGCIHNFGPTYLAHFYSWAKPQSSSQIKIYKNWDPAIKNKVILIDLLVLGFLIYLAPKFIAWKPKKQEPNQGYAFAYVCLGLAIGVLLYLRLTLGG
jgi:hypothetical protein